MVSNIFFEFILVSKLLLTHKSDKKSYNGRTTDKRNRLVIWYNSLQNFQAGSRLSRSTPRFQHKSVITGIEFEKKYEEIKCSMKIVFI